MKKRVSTRQKSETGAAQNRCIWMTAGVISFKLCALDYDCEHCDFDEVMRSQAKSKKERLRGKRVRSRVSASSESVTAPSADSKKPPFFTFSTGEVDEELRLHPAHLWIRRDEGETWKLGIDKLLAYVLPAASKVELYGLNAMLLQNRLCGKVRTEAGIIPLTAPLSGRLVRANPQLGEHPELLQQDPYGEGWMATIESSQDESDLRKYYTGIGGRKFLEEEAQHLRFLLKHRGIEVDNIGDTLPDGGANIRYLNQILPGPVCLRLATELIMSGKQAW
ncbi:MAG: glycine cleavage system protein H [Deltaproteobacteria bacterium]|nr:MAG: glycine cleavage system protein H [Deltaproteobacteria bacterium]